jgi:hypothetical protein
LYYIIIEGNVEIQIVNPAEKDEYNELSKDLVVLREEQD